MNVKRKRIIGLRKLTLTVIALFLIVGAAIFYFPNAFLNNQIAQQLTDLLVDQFGPDALVGGVEIGWTRAVVHDVVIPAGSHGSRLEISRLEFGVDPLLLISQPEQYERVIRDLEIIEPRFFYARPRREDSAKVESDGAPAVIRIPEEIYSFLLQLDSLSRVDISSGSVWIGPADSAHYLLREVSGSLVRNSESSFALALEAYYLESHRNRFSLRGTLRPEEKRFQTSGSIIIPDGEFPLKPDEKIVITSDGGEILMNLWSDGELLDYNGSIVVSNIRIAIGEVDVEIPSFEGDISGSAVEIVVPEIQSDQFEADLYGSVRLFGSQGLNLRGNVNIDSLQKINTIAPDLPALRGAISASYRVQGPLDDPTLYLTARSDTVSFAGVEIVEFASSIRATGNQIVLDRLDFNHRFGHASGHGTFSTAGDRPLEFSGNVRFASRPSILGVESDISQIDIEVDGRLQRPDIRLTVFDTLGSARGRGSLRQHRSADALEWVFEFQNPSTEYRSEVTIAQEEKALHIRAEGAHHLLEILFPPIESSFSSVEEFDVDFRGDDQYGELRFTLDVRSDTTVFLPRLLRHLEFDGRYTKQDSAVYDVAGDWSGISGSNDPFFGQGAIHIDQGVFAFQNFFIDEVGAITGEADLSTRFIDVGVSIENLPLSRFPIRPDFFDRTRLSGDLSGEIRLTGQMDDVDWYGSLTLINGTIFGIPDYWCNVEAFGNGLRAESANLTFGRDIQKIIEASGFIDFEADTINVQAQSGSANSNDFFVALTGLNKLITGDLDARILATGKATKPVIEAELKIVDGELLGEIFVDSFSSRIEYSYDSKGSRVLRIPSLSFGKQNTYRFFGELSAVTEPNGKLSAHLEGSGDFLDVLDQIDRTYSSYGSDGSVILDFGGTYSHPQFLSGRLTIQDGRFTYPSASPAELGMEVDIHVVAPGVVDTGFVTLRDGEQFLTIAFLQNYAAEYSDLKSLIIPSPRLDLGILELTTSENGISVRLPGFMKPDWIGTLTCGGGERNSITISSQGENRLLISGGVTMENARITFPFISTGRSRVLPVTQWLLARLTEAKWDLQFDVGTGNHYDVEITGFKDSELSDILGNQPLIETIAGYLDHLTVDAIITPSDESLLIRETIEDSTFHLLGRLTSNRGRVEYLDQTFDVDYVYADFDETSVMPVLEGRAQTYGLDSLNRSVPVYLTIYELDTENKTRYRQGRFDKITYVLESDNSVSPEATLQLLGYGSGDTGAKAEQLLTRTALSAAKRAWLDPIARQLERSTIFDEIALTPGGGRSQRLFRQQREQAKIDTTRAPSVSRLFSGSHVTIGKYITDDIFLTYTGELVEGTSEFEGSRLGLVHFWNLEVRMDPLARDLVLDLEVEYDEIERRRDESIALKYSFTLEP